MKEKALELITKALPIIDRHLTELSGLSPLTGTAATTIQNYIKTLVLLTKEEKSSDDANLSDDDLLSQVQAILKESEDET